LENSLDIKISKNCENVKTIP